MGIAYRTTIVMILDAARLDKPGEREDFIAETLRPLMQKYDGDCLIDWRYASPAAPFVELDVSPAYQPDVSPFPGDANHPTREDALLAALPYVEGALDEEGFKRGKVRADVTKVRAALALENAVPDILAALKLAEKHVASVCEETGEADLPDWFADLAAIRAAIAKAEAT